MKNLLRFRVKALMLTAIFLIGIAGMLSAQKIAIIDAGSSGSVLYVYEWNKIDKKLIVLHSGSGKKDDTEGKILAKVDNTNEAAKAYLTKMTSEYQNTDSNPIPLYVLATAGMRKPGDKNPIYDTIESCTISGYSDIKAMTISGCYEGLYAWIAANYENGKIGIDTSGPKPVLKEQPPTCGILEIGGASMQITYKAEGRGDYIDHKKFDNIYSKSYLGCGVNSVFDKYISETEPYDFTTLNMGLKAIPSDTFFWGLGGSIGACFEEGKTLDKYIQDHKSDNPTDHTHHSYMNGIYIKYITGCLGLNLDTTLLPPVKPSNWTEGAALDILINENEPEAYNNN